MPRMLVTPLACIDGPDVGRERIGDLAAGFDGGSPRCVQATGGRGSPRRRLAVISSMVPLVGAGNGRRPEEVAVSGAAGGAKSLFTRSNPEAWR